MEKQKYVSPELEITLFAAEDVSRTSVVDSDDPNYDPEGMDPNA